MRAQPSITYLIDDDYNVVWFNHAAATTYPQLVVGKKCHQCLMGLDEPCPPCPIANGVIGPKTYFDPIRKIAETVDAVDMALPDGAVGHALIISSSDDEDARHHGIDQLTGQLNRSGFRQFCSTFQPDSPADPMAAVAVDVTNFDTLAFRYGAEAANDVIRYAARAFKADHITFCNAGGGRMLGIVELWKMDDIPNARTLLDTIEKNSPLPNLGLKMGIFHGTIDQASVSAMVNYAESALNSIRSEHGISVNTVDIDQYRALARENELLSEILAAFDKNEFDIYLQPKCEMSTSALVGSEALVRWIKPDGTIISPRSFIPLLESKGLIARLDLFVWERAFQTVRSWIDDGLEPLPISVNVSRVDIMEMNVAETFIGLSDRYDIAPRLIEVEITESAYVEEGGAIQLAEQELKKAGFHVLIDDFGSGFSSLSMLKDIDADVLKLDMGFLQFENADESRAVDIIRSVLDMAHQLDMYVIVEGVETAAQAQLLLAMGCQFAQGFYYYRPMPRTDFRALMTGATSTMIAEERRHSRKSSIQRLTECFMSVAEVHTYTGSYRFIRNAPEPDFSLTPRAATFAEYNERYIENGYIHPSDVDAYRKACDIDHLRDLIAHGGKRERNAFRFLSEDKSWRWYVLEVVRPEDYSPEQPWVLFTWKEAADDISQREETQQLMYAMYDQVIRFNARTMEADVIKGDYPEGYFEVDPTYGCTVFTRNLVQSGRVHADDAAGLIELTNPEKLRTHFMASSQPRSALARVKGSKGWVRVILEFSRSVDWTPQNPILLLTQRTAQVAGPDEFTKTDSVNYAARRMFEADRNHALHELIFNVTRNELVLGGHYDAIAQEAGISEPPHYYSEFIEKVVSITVHPDHRQRILSFADPDRLKAHYEAGNHYDFLEYQRIYPGETRTMRIGLHLYRLETDGDLWCNHVVVDIES